MNNDEFTVRLANLTAKHKAQMEELDRISAALPGLVKLGTITPEQIQEFIETTQQYIRLLEEQRPRWISVKERLPEPWQTVICANEGRSFVGYFCHYSFESLDQWICLPGERRVIVTHWMNLPEPPK